MVKKELIKYGIILLIIAVLTYCGFHYGKKIVGRIRERKQIKKLDGTIDKNNLSYPESQYNVFAKSLFTAMNGWGTDFEAIVAVFKKMRTIDDVLMLQFAFSESEDENETLTEWLHGDLSSSDIETLNQILSERSIIYSF